MVYCIPGNKDDSVSPLSESTLSNSPLSDNNTEEQFFEKVNNNTTESQSTKAEDVIMADDVMETNVVDDTEVAMETEEEAQEFCNGDDAQHESAANPTLNTEISFKVTDVDYDADDTSLGASVNMETKALSSSQESIGELPTAEEDIPEDKESGADKSSDKTIDNTADKSSDQQYVDAANKENG